MEVFWRTRTAYLILNAARKMKKKRHTVHPRNKCSLGLWLRTAWELPWFKSSSQATKKSWAAKKNSDRTNVDNFQKQHSKSHFNLYIYSINIITKTQQVTNITLSPYRRVHKYSKLLQQLQHKPKNTRIIYMKKSKKQQIVHKLDFCLHFSSIMYLCFSTITQYSHNKVNFVVQNSQQKCR